VQPGDPRLRVGGVGPLPIGVEEVCRVPTSRRGFRIPPPGRAASFSAVGARPVDRAVRRPPPPLTRRPVGGRPHRHLPASKHRRPGPGGRPRRRERHRRRRRGRRARRGGVDARRDRARRRGAPARHGRRPQATARPPGLPARRGRRAVRAAHAQRHV